MQHLQVIRAVRVVAVAIASTAVMGVGANAASATTIRQGTSSTLPTSSSPAVATGTQISAPLSSFSYSAPQTSAGSCTGGSVSGSVTANGGTTATLGSTTLAVNTCTDNNPTWTIVTVNLSGTPVSGVDFTGTASPQGTWSVSAPTFIVRIQDTSGLISTCNMRLYPPTGMGTLTGRLSNGTSTAPTSSPSLTFTNVRVYATATSGWCPQQYGFGSSVASSSLFSWSYRPLRTGTISSPGNYAGIFP